MKRYFISVADISKYLCQTIRGYGYFVRWNKSDYSESFYLKINVGTRNDPKAIHVRISNHSVPPDRKRICYDFDICGSHARKGATTYVKFLAWFAGKFGEMLPKSFQNIQPGTAQYKKYAIELQHRAAA